ncbi:MAG TPA: VWA domain-containing protein [Terriglobales bacterium]|nr:VWA domain-containing protein [Terriglobales bacterium]
MHPRNNPVILILIVALALTVGFAFGQQQDQVSPGELETLPRATSSVEGPTQSLPATTTTPSVSTTQPRGSQPTQTRPPATGTGQELERQGEQYVMRKDVQEVQLYATVYDQHQRMITNLNRNDFAVFEDNQPQQITSFHLMDVPVSLGIIIDNSGSMRDKRAAVNEAALNLVRSSNPQDEVFVVNFSDEMWLDQDYTNDIGKLKEALEKIDSRGGTALYDAVIASADHLAKTGTKDKKVLVVVTDGEDNASRESLERAVRMLQDQNGPVVYTIGILGDDREAKRAKRALTQLSLETGGVYFFPRDASEVDEISRAVAHDIRNQYIIGYKPTNPQVNGGYRTVKVEAKASGYGRLQVRTRSGYYAEQQRAAKQQ